MLAKRLTDQRTDIHPALPYKFISFWLRVKSTVIHNSGQLVLNYPAGSFFSCVVNVKYDHFITGMMYSMPTKPSAEVSAQNMVLVASHAQLWWTHLEDYPSDLGVNQPQTCFQTLRIPSNKQIGSVSAWPVSAKDPSYQVELAHR